jgi:hypothetical protein
VKDINKANEKLFPDPDIPMYSSAKVLLQKRVVHNKVPEFGSNRRMALVAAMDDEQKRCKEKGVHSSDCAYR